MNQLHSEKSLYLKQHAANPIHWWPWKKAGFEKAKKEMSALFPQIAWNEAEWGTFFVERAEPQQPGLLRPDNAWLSPCDDLTHCVAAWPTKLTLVPNLGKQMQDYWKTIHLEPVFSDVLPATWPRITRVATAPWQTVVWQKI